MLKTGLLRSSTAVFLTFLNYRAPAAFFFPPCSRSVYCCAGKENHRDCERAWPLRTTSFNNRWLWKEVHKSINPRLLTGSRLKPLRWLPVSFLTRRQTERKKGIIFTLIFTIRSVPGQISVHLFRLTSFGSQVEDVLWGVVKQPWTQGPCKYKVNTENQGHDVHQIFKGRGLMGCALEIGWVNKERGIVSFTWLILLTSLFAPSVTLSRPFAHSLFLSCHLPTLFSPRLICTLFRFAPSLHLPPLPLFLCPARVSSVPFFEMFFFFHKDLSRTAVVKSVHLLQSEEPLFPPSASFCACAKLWHEQVNVFFLSLVHIIGPAWYEMLHWLHRFKPQSAVLFSWFCMIN